MDNEQKTYTTYSVVNMVAGQLMAALIKRGAVRQGEDVNNWNIWCAKKAIALVTETNKQIKLLTNKNN